MRLYDFVKELDGLFCKQAAVEDDNVGLQIGKTDQQIDRVLLTVDITDEVIEESLDEKAGLIFTHHPLIFDPLPDVTGENSTGKKIIRLIENGVAVYSAHTNYDLMPGGVNDLLAGQIGLTDIDILAAYPYEDMGYDIYGPESITGSYGIGRFGRLKKPESLDSFMESLKIKLELKNLRWMADNARVPDEKNKDKKIDRVAVVNGSANSVIPLILNDDFSCDLLVAGELKYSNALSLTERGIIVVEIGHGESEKIAINGIYSILANRFKELDIVKSRTGFKPWRYHIE